MLRLISFLLTGCWHVWEIEKEVDVYEPWVKERGGLPSGFQYTLQCKKCGNVKSRKFLS